MIFAYFSKINIFLHFKFNQIFSLFNRELFGYLIASFLSLMVDLLIFFLCINLFSSNWFFASTFSFLGGLITNYLLSIFFVFSNRKIGDNKFKEFFYFTYIGIGGLIINHVVFYVGIELLFLNVLIIKFISVGIGFIFNYTFRKYFLF
jgi:putative flippase GtrA